MVLGRAKELLNIESKRKIKRLLGIHPTITLLRKLEKIYGQLSSVARAQCDDYASEVLGGKVHAPWLYVYTLLAGEFRSGWIPDSYYGSVVVPATKGGYGDVSELKAFQAGIFGDCMPDILYRVNGRFWDTRGSLVPNHKVCDLLFDEAGNVVFKSDLSKQGRGVVVLGHSEVSEATLDRLGNGVYQRYIHPHPMLAKFHSDSVATLRLTTVVDVLGKVSLRACYLRFGTGNDRHVKSESHIRVPVDLDAGMLSDRGYTVDWHQVETHPTSGQRFAGIRVPSFAVCVAKVKQLHKYVPFVQCIGWDVTIDHNGEVQVLEWNGAHNDIKFSEATQGPCFTDLGWELLWKEGGG